MESSLYNSDGGQYQRKEILKMVGPYCCQDYIYYGDFGGGVFKGKIITLIFYYNSL
jgi:hypothetical protein